MNLQEKQTVLEPLCQTQNMGRIPLDIHADTIVVCASSVYTLLGRNGSLLEDAATLDKIANLVEKMAEKIREIATEARTIGNAQAA